MPTTHSTETRAQLQGSRRLADDLDEMCINTIRTLSMDAVQAAKSGHPGTPMGLAPTMYTLWQRYLRFDPDDPVWPNRDRFVLSVGHASMLLYSILHLTGVKAVDADYEHLGEPAVTLEDIKRFRQLGSKCPGHPEYHLTSGVETTTGPLGQGCGNSVGMAIAGYWLAAHFNRPGFDLFNYDVYALCGDGDMMEGVSSEAASLAGHLALSNLCWIYDSNRVSIEGHTDLAFSDDVAARFLAYGWNVTRVGDANDTERIARSLDLFRRTDDRPTLIIVESHIAYGAPHKQDTSAAHGEPLGEDEVRGAKRAYGWPEDAHFLVPDGVYEHFRSGIGGRGRRLRDEWYARLESYHAAHAALADEIERMHKRESPEGWDGALPTFAADAKGLATRDSSGKVLNAIAQSHPWLVGGAADLAPSTKTRLAFGGAGDFEANDRAGRNLHFGVREHAMGAIVNGLALSRLRAYGATFLIFSDYMKPPVRLSALMELPAIWIFTHDSIALGEDGPTHQPVEQLNALRAIPGMIVLRPADANEVVEAWRVIMKVRNCPVSLVLTRQAVPTLDRRSHAAASGVARGAYVLADSPDHAPEVILIGSGSEVHLCVQAHEELAREGIAARVVSMPSWELFEQQDDAYRESVLPRRITARVSVEQGSVIGWDRYVGATGAKIGMHTFGASAPLKDLLTKFGFTTAHIVAAAKEQKARTRRGKDAVPTNRLQELKRYGQSVWLDFLSRRLVEDGRLARLVDEDGLAGVTSNPSIFEKAIMHDKEYDAALRETLERGDADPAALYEQIAVHDIQQTADVLRSVYDETGGGDGYVSLEVSPYLAHDTQATIAEAQRLWRKVARDNVMIKVPATPEGLPAIRELTAEGVNVNITLLFSQQVYEEVAQAYLSGAEELVRRGGDVRRLASVASFFVSRIDTAVDKLIDERRRDADPDARKRLEPLKGKVAIANAKLAYQRYLRLFSGPRWEALAAHGVRRQRLLWGSTGTKNRAYSDVMYIEELIGPETVNTVPPATLDAFRDHGRARASLQENIADAEHTLAVLATMGVSLEEVTAQLVGDGVRLFAEAFDGLLAAVALCRIRLLGGALDTQDLALPEAAQQAHAAALHSWQGAGTVRNLWRHEARVWTGADEAHWLGWLRIAQEECARLTDIQQFAREIREAGFTHALLLGMGGSSLGPEVIAQTFGPQPDYPKLTVLDSTDPGEIKAHEERIDVAHTLFIVSSKSGTTLEPNIFQEYFYERVRETVGDADAGSHFIAITDPGSKLQELAGRRRFRRVFFGVPSIGGRYSVLSDFGIVPAAIMGVDVKGFLDAAQRMANTCAASVPPSANPGVQLGIALGLAAQTGRDKLTVVTSPALAGFGAWLEQLFAESTGKRGLGIVPVAGEALGPPAVYGTDRFFAYLHLEGEPDEGARDSLAALQAAGHPVVRITVHDRHHLAQEFFRWEFATAVAGAVLGINPFDQPDVEASKVRTRELTAAYERDGCLPHETPLLEEGGLRLYTDERNRAALTANRNAPSVTAVLKTHLDRLLPADYFALLAYIPRDGANERALQEIRLLVRDARQIATCVGFGPRFLHSTGQAYKGGPNSGVFLQITCDDAIDLDVPGQRYTFGVVKAAQASGDFDVLAERGRRALRVHLGRDVASGLEILKDAVRQALV